MLHIILLILKIIGWILLAVLGLIVLLICVTLFVPLRYRANGSCKGTLDSLYGRIHFSWLCHLISGFAVYENGRLDWTIRIAWKKLRAEDEETDSAETEKFPYKEEPAKEDRKPPAAALPVSDKAASDKTASEKETIEIKKSEKDKTEAPEDELLEKLIAEDMKSCEAPPQGQAEKNQLEKKQPEKKQSKKKQSENQQSVIQKIQAVYEKIKYTFHKICDTMKTLFEKKETLETFILDEVHQSALAAAITEVKRLLRFLKPRKVQADVRFGFEDPCITGQVLAVLSVIYPFIGEHTNIQPDFEQKILEGEVMISGRMRALYAMIMGWNLIWNKNVRMTMKHVRNFKL